MTRSSALDTADNARLVPSDSSAVISCGLLQRSPRSPDKRSISSASCGPGGAGAPWLRSCEAVKRSCGTVLRSCEMPALNIGTVTPGAAKCRSQTRSLKSGRPVIDSGAVLYMHLCDGRHRYTTLQSCTTVHSALQCTIHSTLFQPAVHATQCTALL